MKIEYVYGDATLPVGEGRKIIAHICNDVGRWGRGFVVALSNRDKTPEQFYRQWHRMNIDTSNVDGLARRFELGNVQFARYDGVPDALVANMIAQRGVRHDPKAPRAVDYEALRECLSVLGEHAAGVKASVHMPRIGCGLGGGSWDVIEEAIDCFLIEQSRVPVTVYDLPETLAE